MIPDPETPDPARPAPGRRPARKAGLRTIARWLTAPLRPRPDFLLIGTMKGGTSSLYRYLGAHPGICKASQKEVHYFDLHFARGDAWYRAHFPALTPGQRAQRLVGEASPYYLYHPHTAARVRATLPAAKLVVLLRDPVERCFSHYRHEARAGREPLSFEAALDAEAARLAPDLAHLAADPDYYGPVHHRAAYRHRGQYAEQLERWFDLFPRDRFYIETSERFFADTAAVYAEVLAFLGAEPWSPPAFEAFNTGGQADPIAPSTRARLSAHYAPHNARLSALLGRELPWR